MTPRPGVEVRGKGAGRSTGLLSGLEETHLPQERTRDRRLNRDHGWNTEPARP